MMGCGTDVLENFPFANTRLSQTLLSQVDEIFLESIREAGLYDKVWQAFAVYLPVKTVGVQGDKRSHSNAVVLRAITSEDGMTADW